MFMNIDQLPPEQQFDFWLGAWDVSWSGAQHGTNIVTRTFAGNVIQENFNAQPAQAFQGMSVSVYNSKIHQWQQTWVDTDGNYWHFTGNYLNDQMVLATDDIIDGKSVKLRMIFYNIRVNELDWRWERSNDGGLTWDLKWQIHYQRK